jgi:hypothetical protein
MTVDLIPGLRDALIAEANQLSKSAAAEPTRMPAVDAVGTGSRTPRKRRARVLAGLAVACGVVAVFAMSVVDRGPVVTRAWAASAIRLAESVPRMLPADAAWKVTYADALSADDGSVIVQRGNRSVEITWYARSQYDSYLKDRGRDATRLARTTSAEQDAELFRYPGTDDYSAMFKSGEHFIEARTQTDIPTELRGKPLPASGPSFPTHFTEASFREFVESLQEFSVDGWLLRMPASVVKPAQNAVVIREMLEDVPLPRGFEVGPLMDPTAPRDPYQLGAKVTGAVACKWIEQWAAATTTGDTAARDEAVRAMSSARRWKVLRTMAKSGAYSETIWQYADEMRAGRPLGMYQDGLGCGQ